jgi:hypothetical protein
MNAIVRSGLTAVLVILVGCDYNRLGSLHVRHIQNLPTQKVDLATSDVTVRTRLIYSEPVWNWELGKYEWKASTCADAPAEALALLGGSMAANVAAEKKHADPVLAAGVAAAFNSGGMQLQRAANQRRTDSLNESSCNMYHAGAINGREYVELQLINHRASIAMAGMESILALVTPQALPPTINVNAPASSASASVPVSVTIGGGPDGSAGQDSPAPATTAAAPPAAGTVADKVTKTGRKGTDTQCKAKSAAQQKACLAAAAAKSTADGVTEEPAPGPNSRSSASQDPAVFIAAIEAIQKLAIDGMDLDVAGVSCLLDESHQKLSQAEWRASSCNGAAGNQPVPTPDAITLAPDLKAVFCGERLYTQVASSSQVGPAQDLVQALGREFGAAMRVYPVEVSPQTLSTVEIRYYGRTSAKDLNDPDYLAADKLSGSLAHVFSPDTIRVINWTCCVAKPQRPGLLELWVPPSVSIIPGALQAAARTGPLQSNPKPKARGAH